MATSTEATANSKPAKYLRKLMDIAPGDRCVRLRYRLSEDCLQRPAFNFVCLCRFKDLTDWMGWNTKHAEESVICHKVCLIQQIACVRTKRGAVTFRVWSGRCEECGTVYWMMRRRNLT